MQELICLTREPFVRVSDMDVDGNIGEGPTQLCDVIGESAESSTRHKDSDSSYTYRETKYMDDIDTHLFFPSKYECLRILKFSK